MLLIQNTSDPIKEIIIVHKYSN